MNSTRLVKSVGINVLSTWNWGQVWTNHARPTWRKEFCFAENRPSVKAGATQRTLGPQPPPQRRL